MKNIINWVVLPSIIFHRAVKFYSHLLDITPEITKLNGRSHAYFRQPDGSTGVALTTKADNFKPGKGRGILVYFNGGDDLNILLSKVKKAGGQVLTTKTKASDEIGYYAIIFDTEGNKVGIHSRK